MPSADARGAEGRRYLALNRFLPRGIDTRQSNLGGLEVRIFVNYLFDRNFECDVDHRPHPSCFAKLHKAVTAARVICRAAGREPPDVAWELVRDVLEGWMVISPRAAEGLQ